MFCAGSVGMIACSGLPRYRSSAEVGRSWIGTARCAALGLLRGLGGKWLAQPGVKNKSCIYVRIVTSIKLTMSRRQPQSVLVYRCFAVVRLWQISGRGFFDFTGFGSAFSVGAGASGFFRGRFRRRSFEVAHEILSRTKNTSIIKLNYSNYISKTYRIPWCHRCFENAFHAKLNTHLEARVKTRY